jgi:DNA mismatch repair ATPase MutS
MKSIQASRILKEEWGVEKERKRDLIEIGELFRYIIKDNADKFYIDDQTWDDLDMNKIYAIIDRTHSTPGEQVLYSILRTPLMDEVSFNKRKDIIEFFQSNREVREKIQMELLKVGRQRGSLITAFLWEDIMVKFKYKFVFTILSLLGLLSLFSIYPLGIKALLYCITPVFAINSYIHYKVKKSISGQLHTIQYLHDVIKASGNFGKIKIQAIDDFTSALSRTARSCKQVFQKTSISFEKGSSDLEAISEYINIFFLVEEKKFFGAIDDIRAHKKDLQEMYLKLGELDALISIASYREGLKEYTIPKLHKEGVELKGTNMAHPLLKNPVKNSININKEGIIITGSNMSGKSTFLRTVGINALFAQTICTCTSDAYEGSYFKILTSISPGDNLIGGKSYYLAEAEALLRIINASGDIIPCLCIIDEIFRGTNPVERAGASVEILDYLVNNNAIVIVATHDLEITEMVKSAYKYYYFSEDISQEGLKFDFIIKEGVSKNRNAVKLMKYLGYPDEIVDKTTKRVTGENV